MIAIREFGKYLCFIGKNAYVIDKTQIPKRQQYMPYMFSDLELHSLFMSIDNLPIKQNNSHIIAPVLFRMMYCCAMRPGEPLKLLREDVDIDKRIIHIKDTKRHANRIININEDLFHLFKDFDYRMGTRNWFFCTPDYMQLESYWSYNLFRTSWVNANLGTLTSAPRPYDLRHNAASRILQKWIDEDKDIMAMLPYLQAHMGHRHINDTLYYVHLLPEHILKSQNIDWSRFNDLYQGKLYE